MKTERFVDSIDASRPFVQKRILWGSFQRIAAALSPTSLYIMSRIWHVDFLKQLFYCFFMACRLSLTIVSQQGNVSHNAMRVIQPGLGLAKHHVMNVLWLLASDAKRGTRACKWCDSSRNCKVNEEIFDKWWQLLTFKLLTRCHRQQRLRYTLHYTCHDSSPDINKSAQLCSLFQ